MKIVFSPEANDCLIEILEYYRRKGNKMHGRKIWAKIILKANKLKGFPGLGPVEGTLTTEDIEYRYLVEGNYKIIYLIIEDYILITDVFDTRQDPEKM